MNILISIGNSDDKLGQAEWAKYVGDVHAAVALEAKVIHGVWFSSPESKYQNAGFSFECDGAWGAADKCKYPKRRPDLAVEARNEQ